MKKNASLIPVLGLVLICFCMRAPMSVVGPLVGQVKESLSLSSGLSGLLTTIPLLIFAAVSPFAGGLLPRLGAKRLFSCCTALIMAGVLLRSYAGYTGLLAGTGLLGLGIGVLNVVMPVWIRQTFPKSIGMMMGVYTASMTALSAVAAGFCVQTAQVLAGWQHSMAIFSAFTLIAVPLWLFFVPGGANGSRAEAPVKLGSVARSFSNWSCALSMGIQSMLFFALIAWLPSMLKERGFEGSECGLMVLVMQLVSLITNFLMPVWFQRFPRARKALALSTGTVYAAGFLLLLVCRAPWAIALSVVLLGLASGLSLSYCLTVIAVKGSTGGEAAGLSSFAQCIGYLLAAPAPFIIGALYDSSGTFMLPILALMILCAPMAAFGVLSLGGSNRTNRAANSTGDVTSRAD